jgi:hypothetical protein
MYPTQAKLEWATLKDSCATFLELSDQADLLRNKRPTRAGASTPSN